MTAAADTSLVWQLLARLTQLDPQLVQQAMRDVGWANADKEKPEGRSPLR